MTKRMKWISLLLLFILSLGTAAQDARELALGAPIERELKGGEVHAYRIKLVSGQYLRVVVEQRGIDVVVRLFGPDGQSLIEMDSPNGTQGPEIVSVVTEAAGEYRLEVGSLERVAPPGRYQVRIEELRAARPPDQSRIAAERLMAEGTQHLAQGTAPSRRRAIEKYEAALPLWRALGDHRQEGDTLNTIGTIYYSLAEPPKALEYYGQALALRQAVGDRRGEAETLNDIGVLYNFVGENQKALEYYGQALPLWQAIGDRREEANTRHNIGVVYSYLSEPQKALEYYGQALPLWRALGDRPGEAITLDNIGGIYRWLGENQTALEYYGQALPLWRALENRRGEAITLNNIGLVYLALDEPQTALEYLSQALPLRRAVGNRAGEAATLNNIGLAYRLLSEPQTALEHFNQALRLSRAVGDRHVEINALTNSGAIHQALGEPQTALDAFGQALQLSRIVGTRNSEANALFGIARVERDRGHLPEARAQMEATLNIIESLRTKVASPELRASYLASVGRAYEFYVDLLMRLHLRQPSEGHDATALQTSERARARSLLETLTEARADIRQGIDPGLLERERTLQQQVNAKAERLTSLLSSQRREEQAAAAKKELESLLTQYQEVQAQIRARSPRYAALTQPQPLSLREIQQQVLDDDTILLEYALGEERSFLWAVTPTSITSFELPNRAEIEAAARRVYDWWSTSRQSAGQEPTEAAATLSQILLGPVTEQLEKKRLLMVSDGALQYVPFAALPKPGTRDQGPRTSGKTKDQGPRTKDQAPLIVEHEIAHLPSASVLAVLRRELAGRQLAAKTVAVLADPVFTSDDERVKDASSIARGQWSVAQTNERRTTDHGPRTTDDLERSVRDFGNLSLDRLRATRREAEGIVTLARETSLKAVDFQANRATATSAELSQYRLLHFATHGLLNSQHPELSGIVLSLVDEQGRPQDGFLRLHEIYNLKLNADLVVLSACQTALGKEIKGEGLVGLTRGFMYAGVPRVVASLWRVPDKATAELMKRFYQGMLREGLTPAAALRAAQVSLWQEKRWRQPYYWAAFVLQGEYK